MSASTRTAPQTLREKVTFTTNTPAFLTLETDPPTETHPGRFGDAYLYFLAQQKIAFLDPAAHQAILGSGARAGDEVRLTKSETRTGNRRAIDWVAELIQAEPEQPPARPIRTSPTAAAHNPTPEPAANLLARALILAMDADRLAGLQLPPDQIVKLAITAYIANNGGRA